MKTLKTELMQGIVNTCLAFTGATLVYCAVLPLFGGGAYSPWDTLLLCAVLSATQGLCNHIPAVDPRPVLRAAINLAEVLLMGILLFNWLQYGLLPLVVCGVAACVVFIVVWVTAAAKMRQDAEDINEAIQRKKTSQP